MQVVALGTSAAYPGPDNACTGWLLQQGDTHLLIDCGTGVLSKLQRFLPLVQITAIVVSHMHADHFLDLIPLRYAFNYALKPSRTPLPIYLPPNGKKTLRRMIAALDPKGATHFFEPKLELQEYDPGAPLPIGAFKVRFAPGNHYIPCWGIGVEGERRVVFTSDTGPSEKIANLARGADLLVTEATYLSVEEEYNSTRGHLTAREAGQLAAQASPGKVLVTHLWPNRDPAPTLEHAQQTFQGDISLAEQGHVYEV